MSIISLLFLTVFILCEPAFSQRFRNISDEYPFPEIREIMQDGYGFIWFSTTNGIIRYDGYQFQHFKYGENKENLNARYIETLYEDSKGKIWIGSQQGSGLEWFDRNTELFHNVCIPNPETGSCFSQINIYTIKEDQDTTLWIGTDKGLIHFNPLSETTIRHYQNKSDDPSGFNDNYVLELLVDRNNNIWAGGINGLNKLNRDDSTFYSPKTHPDFPKGQILDIIESTNGKIFISGRTTKERIYEYDSISNAFTPALNFTEPVNNYLKFDIDEQGNIAFATKTFETGIFSPKNNTITYFKKEHASHHGYYGQRINDVFIDKYGNIWLGGEGVFCKPATRKNIQSIITNGYPVRSIHTIGKDVLYSLNIPYIWNHETKMSTPWWTFPPLKNIRKLRNELQPHPQLYEIQKWGKDNLVMTTTRNVLLYNTVSQSLRDYPQDSGGPFLDFVKGDKHNLYIAEGNNYLRIFDFNKGEVVWGNKGVLSKILYAKNVGLDSLGNHWYGMCDGGVFRYNEKSDDLDFYKFEIDSSDEKIIANIIYEIYTHSSGDIYFGTDNGLWRFSDDSQELKQWGIEKGLPSNMVMSIEEDADHNIWMGTGKGISRYNIMSQSFQNYISTDGFINDVYWQDCSFKGEDGTLYFGGTKGIDFFNPEEISKNEVPPDVYLKNLMVNGNKYTDETAFENLESVVLNHDQNYLEIDILGIHLTSPKGNQYMFQINDRPWESLGSNQNLTLPNLNTGTYTIRAKASNSDGVWSDVKEILKIKIRAPWWQTPWFYMFLLFAFVGSTILYYQYRIRLNRAKESQQTKINKKIAEIELKALQAQMNPHFLFNSLNSVKSFISKGENALASNYLTQFSKLIRLILNNSREKFVRLNDEIEALNLYLTLESIRFGSSFNYKVKVREGVNPDFLEIPPMLLQPFVENSIWHGLLHKENGSKVLNVEILRDGDLIKMIVEDNGIGRKAAANLQTRSSSKKESLGVQITQDRLELLQSIYGKGASIQIKDLKDDHDKALGTRVTIILPIPE